jgi:uncharacterized protein with PQ loop repeat
MLSEYEDIFGFIGSGLYSLMLIPQIYKVWTHKEAASLSYWMLFISSAGTASMLVYAYSTFTAPVLVSNGLYGASNAVLLYLKYRFDGKAGKSDPNASAFEISTV